MRYKIGVPEVHIRWVAVEADNLDIALENASGLDVPLSENGEIEDLDDLQYSHTLESDEFKVRLLDGEEVSSEEAIDRESFGDRVGE